MTEEKLAEDAQSALFDYQKLILDSEGEDWRILYRMRIELANFIERRKKGDQK